MPIFRPQMPRFRWMSVDPGWGSRVRFVSALRVCVLALSLANVLGCISDPERQSHRVVRPSLDGFERVVIDREARPTLPARARNEVSLELGRRCIVHLGAANRGAGKPLVFRASLVSTDGVVSEALAATLSPTQRWFDYRIDVSSPASAIRLVIEGDELERGVWSVPHAACPVDVSAAKYRNVVLVSLDTLRADRLEAYGNESGLTPTLDRIARESTLFERAFSPFPNTLGAHATLFTGWHPSQHGMMTSGGRRIEERVETIASAFAARGYATAAFTENAFVSSDFGFDVGFDRYHNGPKIAEGQERFPGRATETFQRGLDWIRERPHAPFFLFLHTYEVHTPYTPRAADVQRLFAGHTSYVGPFKESFGPLQELAINRGTLAIDQSDVDQIELLYDAEVLELDRAVGRFMSELGSIGLADSTLIVFFSDHGDEFQENGFLGHGETVHAQVLHVPLVFRLPEVVPAGKRIPSSIGLLDVGPTIAELAGIGPIMADAPARSRADWITGIPATGDPVYSELNATLSACGTESAGTFETCDYGAVAVRDDAYTYIHIDATKHEMLYDIRADPDERRDVSEQRPDVARRYHDMVARYRQYTEQTRIDAGRAAVEPETADKLRALGYIE